MDTVDEVEWTRHAEGSTVVLNRAENGNENASSSWEAQKRPGMLKAFKLCIPLLAIVLSWHAVSFGQTSELTLDMFAHREQWVAAFEQMPQARLRAYFLRCDRESREHLLDTENAVRCAMAWDALLKHGFRGNLEALLAWWREHRDLLGQATE